MKKATLFILLMIAVLSLPISAQGNNRQGRGQGNCFTNGSYDVNNQATYSVTILEILRGRNDQTGQYLVELGDGTQAGMVIGSQRAISNLGFVIEPGIMFEVTGVVTRNPAGNQILLAGSILWEGNVIALRDDTGNLVLAGCGRHGHGGKGRGGYGKGKGSGKGRHGNGRNGQGNCILRYLATVPMEELSQAETEALIHDRQEEKLARDVYLAFQQKYQVRIFANIAQAEQQHMDAIKVLLDRYEMEDPAADDTPGVFTDAHFQDLYQSLVQEGQTDLNSALKVGATIEDLDIYDIQTQLPQMDNSDVRMVFQNLLKGSRNHMRAFCGQLAAAGVTYAPQYLTQAEVDSILNSERERRVVYDGEGNELSAACNGSGRGRGGNRGSMQKY